MSSYQHILVALDVFDDHSPVLGSALAIASESSQLSLIYVVEPAFYAGDYAGTVPLDLDDHTRASARERLEAVGKEHNIPTERQIVETGRTATLVHDHAKKLQADLIVIGSHGRHGVQLLLGSTANAVLHGATCDVLAVRIGKKAGQ